MLKVPFSTLYLHHAFTKVTIFAFRHAMRLWRRRTFFFGFSLSHTFLRMHFAIPINKSKRHSPRSKLELDLSEMCFSLTQLYAVGSRTAHPSNVYICRSGAYSAAGNVTCLEVLPYKSLIEPNEPLFLF